MGQLNDVTVVLVGREQQGDENLALRYLASAVGAAGGRPRLVSLSGPRGLELAVKRALDAGAPLVGVSIPDADAAIDALAFARRLRERGFSGHLTCGGALATLVRHELLARSPDFDSVVRHDGEGPLVELAARVAAQAPWEAVPGVSSRMGDGAPAPVLDPTPLTLHPLREAELPRLLGVPVARLLASRGCPGRCAYCGPAALQRQAIAEGRAGGASREALAHAGVGGTRRRDAAAVADEMAELYQERGARFFHLLDDNLLSEAGSGAERWLEALAAGLARRGVGQIALSLQADPATLTPRIVDLLLEIGLIRMAVGVEALTPSGLRALGRSGEVSRNLALVEALRDRGVVVVFNSLLVHPAATPQSIQQELQALAGLRGVHFDALAMAVYPGTTAWQELCEAGAVSGGMLGWRFEPTDPVVGRFRGALVRLRLEAIGRYGINVLVHDVAVNAALARRLRLPVASAEVDRDLGRVLEESNERRVMAWRSALELARLDLEPLARQAAQGELLRGLRAELAPLWRRAEAISARLEQGAPRSRGVLLVASSLAAGFTLALASACGGTTGGDPAPSGGSGGTEVDASVTGGSGGTSPEASIPDASSADADAGVPDGTAPACGADAQRDQELEIARDAACGCFNDNYRISVDAAGNMVDITLSDGTPVEPEVRRCYLDALRGQTFPCLAGDEPWLECVICLF